MSISRLRMKRRIEKAGTQFTETQVYDQRPSTIFSKKIYHYYSGSTTDTNSKFTRDRLRYISQSFRIPGNPNGNFYSSSITTRNYMDDFFAQTENLYYEGTQLVGPGVNLASTVAAIDNRPVVEVYSVNPNQLVYTETPEEGNPGNLIVR